LIVLVVLASFVTSSLANTINISGTFDGDSTFTPTANTGVYAQSFSGEGEDTTYGSFTSSSQSTIDFSSPPTIAISDGMFLEKFSEGTLFGVSSGNGTASGLGTATVTLDFIFKGGTGLFAGDTGEITVTETITRTSPTAATISNGSYTGTLITATPLPAALPLFATGLGAIGLFGWRKKRQIASRVPEAILPICFPS
jgi:hypothetical protein